MTSRFLTVSLEHAIDPTSVHPDPNELDVLFAIFDDKRHPY